MFFYVLCISSLSILIILQIQIVNPYAQIINFQTQIVTP